MIPTILTDIGLTQKEAEVYETLLRLGDSPVADIIDETNTHPQVIYRVLDSLVGKGLVVLSFKRHRKYVRAEDPRILEQIEEKKMLELRRVIPDLLRLQKVDKDAIVRVAKGNDNLRSLRANAFGRMTPGDTYYIIGASGDRFYQVMGEQHVENERKRIKKKIFKKLLAFSSQRKLLDKNDPFREYSEFRYLPEDYDVPASINIFGNTVATLIWSKVPIVITIESEEVAESYRHYFESLWKVAKK